ncbi:hypothetical protein [Haloferula sp.]|uniref:hypothetical protein n=1 Tax=Haloferula sp. TaxID=2497595 RepID=UPI00329A936E
MSGFILQTVVERTDWIDLFPGVILLSAYIALIVTPILGVIYLVSWAGTCSIRKFLPKHRQTKIPGYILAGIIPALVIVTILVSTALDRVFPERIFKNLTGHSVPKGAVVTNYKNTSDLLETHLSIEFKLPASEIRSMLDQMGFSDFHDHGKQEFSPAQVKGDWGAITVDWDHATMTFNYLDV